MNDKLHTGATAAGFAVGCLLIIFGVVLSAFPQFGGNPGPALEYGALFLGGSGLIQWAPKMAPVVMQTMTTTSTARPVVLAPTSSSPAVPAQPESHLV